MTRNTSASWAVWDLHARLSPERVLDSGPAYERARRVWNGAVDRRPTVLVRCQTVADVHASIRTAQRHQLPLSVRGGGHDWTGRALRDGGLVIDVSGMTGIGVDARRQRAIVQGGATVGDVVSAAAAHGLAAATGTAGGTGMTGLTLGGGYGGLTGRCGLALDNLLGAEIVLPDGRLITTDATREPELYWALRGGGGNFGVVTSMQIRLHPIRRVIAGFIAYAWPQATDVLTRLRAVLATAPDELTVQSGIVMGEDGQPVVFIAPVFSGDLAQGERIVGELQRLGTPLAMRIAPMPYADALGVPDVWSTVGQHYAIRTRTVAELTPEVITALVEAGATMTSRASGVIVHHFHGAAARVPGDATAFSARRNHLVIGLIAGWAPGDDDSARHRAWSESVSRTLASAALPGGYVNLLGPDDHEQIAQAYGRNAGRLSAAKRYYDPDGLFSATPLPPGRRP